MGAADTKIRPRGHPWYWLIRWLARNIAFRLLGGIRASGLEHIPSTGPIIFAPAHFSYLDPPLVACSQRRALSFMGKRELFNVPILGPLIRSVGCFPIERGNRDTEALRYALRVLEAGGALLIFPEGSRGDGLTFGAVTPGVAMLAKQSGALVIPAGIAGTHKVWPKGSRRIRRRQMKIVFGRPVTYGELAGEGTERERREAFGDELGRIIIGLCAQAGLTLKTGSKAEPRTGPRSAETATERPARAMDAPPDPQ